MRPHDELSNVPKNIRKNSAALKRRAGFFLAAAFSIALMSGTTRAATKTWDGGAGTGNWSDAANWSPDGVPASADDIILDNSSIAGSYTVSLSTAPAVRSLQVGYSGNTNTIELAVSSATTNVLTVSGGGAAALHITDGGVLKNTSTSATRGILLNTATDVFKMSGTGRYIHAAGSGSAIPQQTAGTNSSSNYDFATASVFENQSGNAASFDATPIYGSYTLNNSGTNTANQNLTINGDVSVVLGTLNVTASGTNTFTIGGSVSISSGATLQGTSTTGIGTINITGNVTGAGTLTGNAASDGTASITIGGNLTSLISFGTGTNSFTFSGGAASASFTPANGTTPTVQNVTVGNGTNAKTVTLGANISVASGKTVTVSNAATLNCGTNAVTGAGALTLSSGATLGVGSVDGIDSGTALGNIRVSGTRTFDPGANYNFNGSSAQVTGNGFPVMVNNFTVSNTAGVSLSANVTVGGVLALTSGDITTGLFTLFMANGAASDPASTGDVVGNVNRSDLGSMAARSFGNPNVQITITAGTVTAMTVNLMKASPSDFGNSARRTYTLKDVVGSLVTATVRLRYLDSELNSNAEGTLELWRKDGSNWVSQGATTRDSTDNWVEQTLITSFSPWTIAGLTGPTYVAMVGYAANRLGKGKVLLEWETGYEVDNLGFNIYRQESGEMVRVNKSMIAGSALFAGPGTRLTAGRSYIWRDKLPEGSDARYWLEEIELNGRSIWHGPIFAGENPPPKAKYLLAANDVSDAKTIEDMNTESAEQAPTLPVEETAQLQMVGNIRLMKADAVGVAAATWTLGSESAVKLSVKREGWYRVTAAELQAAGLAADAAPKRLQLFVDGQEIPMKVVAGGNNKLSAIEFYGIGIDTPSTDSHVYWVTVGPQKGKRIETASGNGSAAPANSFPYSVERRDRSIYLSGIRNGDEENFFGAVVLSSPVNQVVNLPRVDTAAAGQATIEIAMQGLSLLSHHVSVSLNGNHLGAIDFNAQASKSATFTVPMSSLLEGPNTFTVQGQSTVLDVTLVDRIRVTYLRTYTADSNLLKLTAAGEQKVTVGGFTGAGVRVMDVTNPANVSEVQLTPAPGNASTDSVTFSVPGFGNRSLLVFAGDQVRAVAGAVANNKSNLRNNSPKADLVIITHSSLVNSFTPLAALRQAQGLKVAMVDIEDVYDEFSYGNKAPQGVKDFLSFTKSNWRRAPKYVLLAGGASYDPKNYEGQGANDLVPAKLVDTEFMETASDDWFSDFNNDALAEMAMGRLPANNAGEADAMVAKIIGYETSTRSNSVALTSDQNDDFSFEGASDQLKPLVPGTIAKVEIDRGQVGTTVAKQQLLSAISAGQKIVNYTGHGSSTQWRSSFLTSDDARALTNGSRLPLFVMMTCLNGLFQDANLDGLAPALMKSAKGGAVAVWASSGLTEPAEQSVLNQQLYKLLFPTAGTALNLGDATMKAKAAVTDPDIRRTWILFGDPTTRLK